MLLGPEGRAAHLAEVTEIRQRGAIPPLIVLLAEADTLSADLQTPGFIALVTALVVWGQLAG